MLSTQMTPVELGIFGERVAENHLIKNGFVIVEKNHYGRFGELDLIAMDKDVLCFIEVRTRQRTDWVEPIESLTRNKCRRLRLSAEAYLVDHDLDDQMCRFDVVSVIVENDFSYTIELFKEVDL